MTSHRDAAIALLDSLQGKRTRDLSRDTLLAALVHAILATIPDDAAGVTLPRDLVARTVAAHPRSGQLFCRCGINFRGDHERWALHVADEIAKALP